MTKHILVLGAGVSGLSCGIRLLEAGYAVSIWARDLPPHTTSNIAAAIWHPYKVYPIELALQWGGRTFAIFQQLAADPTSGIQLTATIELFKHAEPDPWWRSAVPDFRRASAAELPPGYTDGFVFTTPVIEMGVYLRFLLARFAALGGTLIERTITTLAEADQPIVVNCTGLGAREVAADPALFPIRGQIVRTTRPADARAVMDEVERADNVVCYVIPRSNDCIIGGTVQPHNESLVADPATAAILLDYATALVPGLADATVLEHLVGLRPGRAAVRLERERLADGQVVIHNYGHGGGGVTLSWGCAEDVVRLVAETNE